MLDEILARIEEVEGSYCDITIDAVKDLLRDYCHDRDVAHTELNRFREYTEFDESIAELNQQIEGWTLAD